MTEPLDSQRTSTANPRQPITMPLSVFLFVLPMFAAAGPFLLSFRAGVGQMYAFRLAVIVGIPLLLLTRPRQQEISSLVTTPLVVVGVGWIVWGLGSLIWTPAPLDGLIELVAIVLGVLVTIELVMGVAGRRDRLRVLTSGWGAAFVGVTVVAFIELSTGRHLETSFANAMAARESTFYATATFGNPNALGAFLLMALVISLWRLVEAKSVWGRFVWIIGLAIAPALKVVGGSRTALVGALVCTAVFIWVIGTPAQRIWALACAVAALTAGVLLVLHFTSLTWDDLAATWQIGGELQYGGSAGVRLNLFRNGWDMIQGTWGMGVGAGGFVYAIEHGYGRYDTAGIVNPHNFWLEIGSQYGLVVLLGVCLVLLWLAVILVGRARRARVIGDRQALALAAAGLASLTAYVIGAGSNSSFIPQPTNWAFLGTVGAMIAVGVADSGDLPSGGSNETRA